MTNRKIGIAISAAVILTIAIVAAVLFMTAESNKKGEAEATEEAKLMIPITQAMATYLREKGVEVYTDAFSDNNINLFDTLDYLETHEFDAFVNVHCDSSEAASGTMPLYYTEVQKELGQYLNEGVHERINIPDRGLQYRTDLDTLCSEQVHCPSCLFETGCISTDNEILTDRAKGYGEGLAKGLLCYLEDKQNRGKE